MSESYSPLKDFASPQGGASCDTSPLSFNITNHIHHSVGVAFGQSTVTSPVTMSHFGDHKPEKLKKNEYQAKVKAPKKKGDRKKSAATLMVEREMKFSKTQTSSLAMVTSASWNQTNPIWHSTVYAKKRSKNRRSNTNKRSLCKPITCRHIRRSHLWKRS